MPKIIIDRIDRDHQKYFAIEHRGANRDCVISFVLDKYGELIELRKDDEKVEWPDVEFCSMRVCNGIHS